MTITTELLDELETTYGDKTPKRPCHICKSMNWTLEAVGMGRVTWACGAAKPAHHGGTGDKMDWDHYSRSSHEVTSGDERVLQLVIIARAALELRERYSIAEFEDDTKHARLMLFAALEGTP